VRPPTWIEQGWLVAGRHPCAWSPAEAKQEVDVLLGLGVTLFLDLTEPGELAPYDRFVPSGARHARVPVRDFAVPSEEQIVVALDLIDSELEADGVVYVHCWAGCGRTGVVVGCWLVRHGADPAGALERIVETRVPADARAAPCRPRLGAGPLGPASTAVKSLSRVSETPALRTDTRS
jgi:protein-tyrosine phosphatase